MKLKQLTTAVLGTMLICSCSVKNIAYFNDADLLNGQASVIEKEIRVQPKDKLFIMVNSSNSDIVNRLNLPYVSARLGQTGNSGNGSYSQGIVGYFVDPAGNIQFPMLGDVHVAGKTRSEIADYIRQRLRDAGEAKDATVTVEFMNVVYSVMGEVGRSGRYSVDRDAITIIDAIAMAGDMSITGVRNDVLVWRNEEGMQKVYHVDLTDAPSLVNSPAYYIHQNDIIYVKPNKMRERQSLATGNTLVTPSFWMSVASFATSMILLIKKW